MSQRDVMLALALGAGAGLMFAAAGVIGAAILLTYFCALPLFVVGLRTGTGLLGASVALGMLVAAGLVGAVPGGIPFAVIIGLPVYLLVALALRRAPDGTWYPLGRLATIASLLAAGGAVMISIGIATFTPEGGSIQGTVAARVEQVFAMALTGYGAELDAAARTEALARSKQFAQVVAAVFPGMVTASWLLMLAVNAAIAQALLVQGKRALRPAMPLHEMTLPSGMIAGMAIAIAVAVAGGDTLGYMAANVAVVLATAFLLQGLSVIHTVIRLWTVGPLPFVVFYVVLGFLLGWLAIPIVALGLAEPLVHVRDRLKRRKNGGRS